MKSVKSGVLALVLAAGLSPASGFAAEMKKATISQAFQSMLYLPLYVGMDEGFFAKEGLELTKETAGAPNTALSAVISKSAQFSLHGPEWTAIAASKGAPVKVIANVVNGAAVWVAVAPDVAFDDVKSLKGLKIVTGQMPTTSTSLFMKLLKENGMDPAKDVELMQVPLGTEPGPLVAGQAKAAVLYEPGVEQAVAQGMKVVLGFPKFYGAYAFSAITVREEIDPDLAQRLTNGLERAMRFMQQNEKRTIEIAVQQFPKLDPKIAEAAVKRMLAEGVYPKSVDITSDALKLGLATQIALGNLPGQPDYKTFVPKTYIDTALALK